MWLLETSVRQAIQEAYKSGGLPTAQQQIEYEASYAAANGGNTSRLLTVAGNNAEISVRGVITKTPSFLAMLFGGGNTTYSEIVSALAEAQADDAVDNITLAIDSPGGQFDGLFDAIAAIQTTKKPIKAVVSGVAASAAYAIASQADEIVATNKAARIGSVGVVATFGVSDREVTVTSTEAPKKRPDVTTQEGVDMVREELDALHEIFVDAIAEGRGTTVKEVNAEFGRGATLLAGEALKRGMIDAIDGVESAKSTTATSGGKQPEARSMDRKTLQAQHPDVYAAVHDEGVKAERERVSAHLTMGEASGAMKIAVEAINNGEEYTAKHMAQYNAAMLNNSNINARQEDDAGADAGDNAGASDQGDAADVVASLVEAKLGVEA